MNIILLGQSGFPYGMATLQKMKLIAEGLAFHGNCVTIINRLPVHPPKEPFLSLQPSGTIHNVHYVYTAGSPIRPSSFIRRNIIRLMSYAKELQYLITLNRKQKTDIAIIYETYILDLIYYYLISKFLGFKLFLHYVEYRSKIPGKGFFEHVNHLLFDRWSFYFLHGVLPISRFLESVASRRRPGIPQFLIPTLVDFSQFDHVEKTDGNYFLFCGSADYTSIFELITESFNRTENKSMELIFVTSGSKAGKDRIRSMIAQSPCSGRIRLFNYIDYRELIRLYCHATALLIPLRNTPQDNARFPHKIGEYTAAAKTIITTRTGVIPAYFTHLVNAFIIEEYSADALSAGLDQISAHRNLAADIGNQALDTGRKNFDHIRVTATLNDFFKQQLSGS